MNGAETTISEAMKLWITPEIQKRQAEGRLPVPVVLRKAQIIFYPDDRGYVVRLNDEVKIVYKAKIRTDKEKGQLVYEDDIEDITDMELAEDDDENAGHLTILRIGQHTYLGYDFRYNKLSSRKLLAKAGQFLEAAEQSLSRGLFSPMAENLFGAAELVAKAMLITHDHNLKSSKKHGALKSRVNLKRKNDPRYDSFCDVYNYLSDSREHARYSERSFSIEAEKAEAIIGLIRETLDDVDKMTRTHYGRTASK